MRTLSRSVGTLRSPVPSSAAPSSGTTRRLPSIERTTPQRPRAPPALGSTSTSVPSFSPSRPRTVAPVQSASAVSSVVAATPLVSGDSGSVCVM